VETAAGKPRPWVVLGNNLGLQKALADMKKLEVAASQFGKVAISVTGLTRENTDSFKVSVTVEEEVVDGETVFCVDLRIDEGKKVLLEVFIH